MRRLDKPGGYCQTAVALIIAVFLSCCGGEKKNGEAPAIQFTSLPSGQTNISFVNRITEDDSVNLIMNAYAYMGSGVGIGDFNNDGLPDIFMGANQQPSKLYINRGNMKFEDVTALAGISTSSWITGVSVADVNADGLEDIYLCASVHSDPAKRKNLLFINKGQLRFTEQAASYGLDDSSYSSQAVFFDFDRDGDLDMYLLNHHMDHQNSNNIVRKNLTGSSPARDKLYRNEGIPKGGNHPVFRDISKEAGIVDDGYGLGVVMTDVNNDSWPDLYVANDYLGNDQLWMNNRNGTFTNVIAKSIKHQSYSSMGVDAGDVNNDGWADIISLDMMPEDNYRQKMMYSFLNYDRYEMERRAGYEPEFIRNMLQLNNGLRKTGDTIIPFFSEIGRFSGIAETDWSWSVLMADLDNDGFRDLHITNGLGRDMINSDFITYYANSTANSGSRNFDKEKWYKAVLKKLEEYGTVELRNYCYRNNGDLSFTNVSGTAGTGIDAISNGSAYSDLDNDGDLDLVVNNINREAFVLRNELRKTVSDSSGNFIRIVLHGDSLNRHAIGAAAILYVKGQVQRAEQSPVRGYLSSVDKRIHFGIGKNRTADSLEIIWPDGKHQILTNVKSNESVDIYYRDAVNKSEHSKSSGSAIVEDISGTRGIDFDHQETFFYDYGYQQLLPQKYSQLGPFIADGDINGDGLTDFFVGGAKNQQGRLFIQQSSGNFISKELSQENKQQEDLGSVFFDADGDQDLDLFINSGSNEDDPGSANYLPRLYRNDGKGNFSLDKDALPKSLYTSAQAVATADFDADGDIDIFIGGRITPRQYPVVPASYLLRNDGGRFVIVTAEVCPELEQAGMITAAVWTDIDRDGRPDLIIAGEWMPVRIFRNTGKKLEEMTEKSGLQKFHGQWRSLAVADIDGDGDRDIIAGNIGLNNYYKASADHPIKLFATDLDQNGSIDPVMAYYRRNEKGERTLFPAISRDQFAAQVPLVKKKFLYNHDYAVSDIEKVLEGAERSNILEFTCNETRSAWFENTGGFSYKMHALPAPAQFAPVNAILSIDIDNDGNTDLVLAGNEHQTEVMTGRYDASYGLVLKGDGKGNFFPLKPRQSGLIIDGDVKDLKRLRTAKGENILLAAVNDEPLGIFKVLSK